MQRYASSSPRAKTEGPARIQVDAPGMTFSASAHQALRARGAMKVGRTTYASMPTCADPGSPVGNFLVGGFRIWLRAGCGPLWGRVQGSGAPEKLACQA